MSEQTSPRWTPIDATTPERWHQFFGRQIGRSTLGLAAAFCPTALYFGVEVLPGPARGLAIMLGPLWLGFALLVPAKDPIDAA